MNDGLDPENLERIRKLFEGKTPEQIRELLRLVDMIIHLSMLRGDIKKKISGACTDIRFPRRRKARMTSLRMVIRNSIPVEPPSSGLCDLIDRRIPVF